MARLADLLSVDEAQERILAQFRPLSVEECSINDALGRVLGVDVRAPISLPPFANSSMDGFALAAASTLGATPESPTQLSVVGLIAAGSSGNFTIKDGECARIMTGAPLPHGADAVVPFEDVHEEHDRIVVSGHIEPGACVRPSGNDFSAHTTVMRRGTELDSRALGLLAALGQASVSVSRRPLVGVISTGDELVAPGHALGPGQIYNSNAVMLAAAVREAGAVPLVLESVEDDPSAITKALDSVNSADLALTSGGASVGDFDHIKDVVRDRGDIGFWRVRIRPGKPLLFGTFGTVTVVGLPGNPTSAMVTFEQFVRPAIRRMLGAAPFRPMIDAILDDYVDNRGGRRTYARVTVTYREGAFHVSLSGRQDSAMLLPLSSADGLLIVPEERTEMHPGDVGAVQVWRLPHRS